MKIIILGAGRIGESVADTLVSERNDITVVDTDAARLQQLEERLEEITQRRGSRVRIVGHSLGGRLALMSSADVMVAVSPSVL